MSADNPGSEEETMELATLFGIIAAYWIVVGGGWLFYTTRPTTQARARARHFAGAVQDPATGNVVMSFRLAPGGLRIAAILLGPPLLMLVAWLATRG